MIRALLIIGLAGLGLAAVQAQAPADLAAAQRAGIVGERYDGYLGFREAPTPQVRRQVGAINIKRRALYGSLAQSRNVTVQVAGAATGCELLARTPVGQAYLLSDNRWRVRQPGEEPPKPDYCP